MKDGVVLDTNVLSSFHRAGWFDSLACWDPETSIVVPERVWTEFQDYTHVEPPDWLSVVEVNLNQVESRTPGALSLADWSCIALAETRDSTCVITNDRAMHTIADERDTPLEWGTLFLLRTFQRCGIRKEELVDGQEEYIDDLGLPEEIAKEIRTATKGSDLR